MTHKDLAKIQQDMYKNQGTWTILEKESAFNSIQFGIQEHEEFDVVCFRGSLTVLDWLRDGQLVLEETSLGSIHSGFARDLEMIKEIIDMRGRPVVLTGHSLGAARAVILASLLNETPEGIQVIDCVTWGLPGIGNNLKPLVKGTTYVNTGLHTQFSMCRDPITLNPPSFNIPESLIVGRLDTGKLLYLPEIIKLHSMDLYAQFTPETEINSPLGGKK